MIDRPEIMELAREFGLAPNVVEKDYVLGWLLAGISNHSELGNAWVFKGGTCLKKCYFETYRFSEDLDFTLPDATTLDEIRLRQIFNDISEWVYDQAGIECPHDTFRFEVYKNKRGGISAEGRVGYRGPMQRRGDSPRIKLDLTSDELLVLKSTLREVHHPYSDKPDGGIQVQCYSYEEVFAEKIRALAERERPRDLYDVVHLFRHTSERPDRTSVLRTLEEKCAFKGIEVPTMANLEGRPERAELEAEWANMLAHQLPALPPFEQFWSELPAVFDWLYGAVEKAASKSIPPDKRYVMDKAWRPPPMVQAWHAKVPLEIIRFAAANHLCVNLAYQGSQRLIEPYSLGRTQDGNLLLHAVKHQTGEPRSYRVDRIEGAEATQEPFVPRYAIEFSASGPLSAPATARRSIGANPFRTSTLTSRRTPRRSKAPSYGPKYVHQCTLCGKKFTRKSNSTRLNPHKDKQGYPCPGRTGMYVTTKY
ncbi:MAG TPA: WYL domain-containing protein [Acidiferrobacteraceae bacterium]|nr:WYL domain-containing protein [Acidiferrobacteraceae bacterium]